MKRRMAIKGAALALGLAAMWNTAIVLTTLTGDSVASGICSGIVGVAVRMFMEHVLDEDDDDWDGGDGRP